MIAKTEHRFWNQSFTYETKGFFGNVITCGIVSGGEETASLCGTPQTIRYAGKRTGTFPQLLADEDHISQKRLEYSMKKRVTMRGNSERLNLSVNAAIWR